MEQREKQKKLQKENRNLLEELRKERETYQKEELMKEKEKGIRRVDEREKDNERKS